MHYRVSEDEHGQSLLSFLRKKTKEALSVKDLKQIIASKQCKVGGRIECFPSRKLAEGENIEVDFTQEKKEPSNLSIIFEDPFFVVVNKPPGLECIESAFRERLEGRQWFLVHRLDKDTSGALLLAKSGEAAEEGKKLFSTRAIEKNYLAVVEGDVSSPGGKIENFLGKKGSYEGQTLYGSVSATEGKKAITIWKKLTSCKQSSLLFCDLKTGRTHQIRVHLSEMGHSILGDFQYGPKLSKCTYSPRRHLLHAWKIRFLHPFTKLLVEAEAPLPEDFQKALRSLKLESKKIS